ncbi:MAG: tyrosine-type recombinase/integrase [Planctomycetota bacterium]|nr:tyrosine-type recombinase/integrase [Planctomycetota bacterium]
MPKKAKFPKPSKRYVRGAWVILWRFSPAPGQYRQYTVSTRLTRRKDDEVFADVILRQFSLALTQDQDRPVFPAEYSAAPGVLRYLSDRDGSARERNAVPTPGHFDALLQKYDDIKKMELSPGWHATVMCALRKWRQAVPDLGAATREDASDFLHSVHAKGLKRGSAPRKTPKKRRRGAGIAATRNRFLVACGGFYRWLVENGYRDANPFRGIPRLKESVGEEDIVYCTREERGRIIAMARASGWPDWIAVPVAFYAGMRREEIARMRWPDALFAEGRAAVPVTKTKRRRVLPLAAELRSLLEAVPEKNRVGFIVPIAAEFDRVQRLETLARKIRKINAASEDPIPEERIGWNAWRHTFGSLLAQAGVSLDKICSWMGNTPEVCRRHYAQFVPRGSRDDEIDRL